MSLILAIESSSNEYRVVIGREREVVFDSSVDNCEGALRTLGGSVACGLETLRAENPPAYENVIRVAAETCELEPYRYATDHLHIVVRRRQ